MIRTGGARGKKKRSRCIGAVSYTHLDVYKRQEQGFVQIPIYRQSVVLELDTAYDFDFHTYSPFSKKFREDVSDSNR